MCTHNPVSRKESYPVPCVPLLDSAESQKLGLILNRPPRAGARGLGLEGISHETRNSARYPVAHRPTRLLPTPLNLTSMQQATASYKVP
jgi:hypothetical protein